MLSRVCAVALLLAAPPLAAGAPQPPPAPAGQSDAEAALKAHVMFLADDVLKGREAGTPEFNIAARYVAARFYAAGLRPAGDHGDYLQTVPLVSYRVEGPGSLALDATRFVYGEDYVPAATPRAQTRASAPVVFVGYGIDAPGEGRDDYAGVDARGKVVAFLSGAPRGLDAELRAFLGSTATKQRFAARRGAVGVIVLPTPASERVRPFAREVANLDHARMTWAAPDGAPNLDTPDTPVLATLSLAGAAKLFGGAPTSWATVTRALKGDNPRPKPVTLKGTLTAESRSRIERVTSYNVAGLLPGSDPAVADQVVVLSAHLDHIGVTKPVNGDAINNGALDDAIGIASLIEEAKRFQAAGAPRRSILFLAVTAEEKGLIGSDYFVEHPTVPAANIVADVNLDMPILTYRFQDVVAFGGDRSTLGPIIQRAAAGIGVTLSPDPMPDEAIFVRSDHFRFVERGIPSVFLWPGHSGEGKAATELFMSTHYHRPSDDLSQPIDWGQGVRFVDLNYRIARGIADAPARPVWNKGDYFGTLFGGPMAD